VYSLQLTGIFCQEKCESMFSWKMFPREAIEAWKSWFDCKEIAVRTATITKGKYVVLAYGKNF
jgi:hypothetical protein